jgi:predicted amidophosphoribosyltransferase
MRLCVLCSTPGPGPLCDSCRSHIACGPAFLTPGGVVVTAGLAHRGVARRLVHALKYAAVTAAAEPLADAMAARLPDGVQLLIPVPRAPVRRWKYGIDAADVLATLVGRARDLPVMRGLRPPWWWPRHAGRGERPRAPVPFRARHLIDGGAWALVDDVATSGATLDAAASALGAPGCLALVATAPSRVGASEGSDQRPRKPGGGVASPRPIPGAPLRATLGRDLDTRSSWSSRVLDGSRPDFEG